MKAKNFDLSIDNHIAKLFFNRPKKANALNRTSWEEMKTLFETLDENPAVRVIILGGNGPHFCSGIDLELLMEIQQFNQMDCEGRKREKIKAMIDWLQECVNAIEKCRKPVIATIHKACLGAGLDIAAACDMRFCTGDAFFSIKEVDLGLVADLGVLQRLPRLIPPGIAAELAYSGRNMPAAEALQCGLVNRVFSNIPEMQEGVGELAQTIAAKSPLVVRGIKQNLLFSRDHTVGDGLEYAATWNAATILSKDILEAFQANMEKRSPKFEE